MAIAFGLWVGGLFPVASELAAAANATPARSAAKLYAADLLGGAGGALVVGTFLVPVIGTALTCLLVALLALGVGIVVGISGP